MIQKRFAFNGHYFRLEIQQSSFDPQVLKLKIGDRDLYLKKTELQELIHLFGWMNGESS